MSDIFDRLLGDIVRVMTDPLLKPGEFKFGTVEDGRFHMTSEAERVLLSNGLLVTKTTLTNGAQITTVALEPKEFLDYGPKRRS